MAKKVEPTVVKIVTGATLQFDTNGASLEVRVVKLSSDGPELEIRSTKSIKALRLFQQLQLKGFDVELQSTTKLERGSADAAAAAGVKR